MGIVRGRRGAKLGRRVEDWDRGIGGSDESRRDEKDGYRSQ